MPRIRTVKPEFWSHPVMCRQDDATRLMAVALLNYADDHGYFYAEPAAVRSFARPFDEDSTIIRRAMAQLIKIGYIEVREHPEMGPVGRVSKFGCHQRVDRPNPSKIKDYFDSSNVPRPIVEEPAEEGKGKEGKGKEARPSASPAAPGEQPNPVSISPVYLSLATGENRHTRIKGMI